ncbi:hypothetical protein LSTR_LSTR001828 [Laodelphax striatellus]|uniref:Zinc finger CCCH domain-containing protein 3 n=1 Tax=Laodelphax striatellus TaxID=195883 RepID=A0A482WFT7_LAOST|nr:hypothetical protein LSTR_LSTR001828 [Laodelphax striatellus]
MIREREKMLQTMTTQQATAIPLEEISTKSSGNTSVPKSNSSHSSAKCPSCPTIKPVIPENKKSQTSFKTTENVILNSKSATGSRQLSSISKPTSRANNIFINPKFQNPSLLSRLAVESSNKDSKNDNVTPSTSTQCNKTINGIHVNPNFRSKMIQNSLTQQPCIKQHEFTNIGSSDYRNSGSGLPNTSVHSIPSELGKTLPPMKEKPGTLHVNPKLILNSSSKTLESCVGSKSIVLMINPNFKQPLTSRNSQDNSYQNRISIFSESNVEKCENKFGKNYNFQEKSSVKNNNKQPSFTRKDIIQSNSMNSTSSELLKVLPIPVEGNMKSKIINNRVHPAMGKQKIIEASLKNSVPFKPRNSLMNRGRKFAWSTYSSKINNSISKLPNTHYKFTNVNSQLHRNNSNINVSRPKNRCWKKPPEVNSFVKILESQTVPTSTNDTKMQTCSLQIGSSLDNPKSNPSTSKTALVAVSRTKIVRKSRTSLKSHEVRSLGTNPTSTRFVNSPNLRKEFQQNINQPSCSKTTLVAISPTKVVRKLKNSHKVSHQNSNPQPMIVNRRKSVEQRTNNNYYSNPVSRLNLLRMKYKKIENFYRNVNRQQSARNSLSKEVIGYQHANVGSRLKFVNGQKYKTSNLKVAGSQNSSRLISLSRNKLIREQNSNTKPLLKRSPSMSHFAARNNRIVSRFHTSSHLALNRNRYNLIRDRLRMRRQFHPYFQSADVFRMKYRNSNANYRRHLLSKNRANNFKKQPLTSRGGGLKQSSRKRMKSLTIEGVKYHSSRLKLQRKPSIKDMKTYQKQLVSVQGERFEVGNGGRTLKRIGEGPARLNKVYLDGVAFIRSKDNDSTMFRTNTHNVRHLLRLAKQRSIAQLTKKMRKNNEPCPIYHRFGKCSGKENGSCCRVHDKKHVAVCRRFLRGDCDNKNCLLSHEVAPTKMPTCRHFLAGICTRENCPYLHVKLSNSAPICIKFLQGYCQHADKCKNRHIEVCPEYEETSKCSKGKCCPYPHPKNYHRSKFFGLQTNKTETKTSDEVVLSETPQNSKPLSKLDANTVVNRYYTAYNDGSKMAEVSASISGDLAVDRANDSGTSWLKTRPKIGQLEAFIPFEENK